MEKFDKEHSVVFWQNCVGNPSILPLSTESFLVYSAATRFFKGGRNWPAELLAEPY